jgi:hypothetical protein
MAISGQNDSSTDANIVGIAEKNHSPGSDSARQARPVVRFDLSMIRRTVPDKIRNSGLFQAKSWYVPPPSPPASRSHSHSASRSPPLPPPQPSAPHLPYTFIGRMIDGNIVTLYLSRNNQQYSVKLNDVLDGEYKVDKITDKSALLTYLPLNIQQELVFNSTAIGVSALSASESGSSIQLTTTLQAELPR